MARAELSRALRRSWRVVRRGKLKSQSAALQELEVVMKIINHLVKK